MSEHIIVSEVAGGAHTITLDRPEKKNALSIAPRDEVSSALDGLASDSGVKVVVTRCTEGFCL